jgi:hypothetical protein
MTAAAPPRPAPLGWLTAVVPLTGADGDGALEEELSRLLGEPWDCELELLRCAADGAPVRWLHATG